MIGKPAVTQFQHDGREQLYVFVCRDDGRLAVCFWNAAPNVTSWQWDNRERPGATRLNGSPDAITSIQYDGAAEHFLHAFVRGANGHLYEHFWDGSEWRPWEDYGTPNQANAVNMSPGVLSVRWTYIHPDDDEVRSTDAQDRLLVFCWGVATDSSNNSLLWLFDRTTKLWQDQGVLPSPGIQVMSEPAVMMYYPNVPYAFVVGTNGHLYVNRSVSVGGNKWQWLPLGQPSGNENKTALTAPGLVSFTHDRELRIYAFVRGSDGHLWNHFWRPSGENVDAALALLGPLGTWGDLGAPDGASVASECAAVTYQHEGTDRIYVFFRGSDDRLYVRFWDGVEWCWSGLGRPTMGGLDVSAQPNAGNTTVSSAPTAITFDFVSSGQTRKRIYVFLYGGENHLHVCYWNGVDQWLWTDLGIPY